jgi:hypothetical protein
MIVPVALFAGMLRALQIDEGTIEKAEAAPSALAESFRNRRLCIVRFIARRDVVPQDYTGQIVTQSLGYDGVKNSARRELLRLSEKRAICGGGVFFDC